VESVETAPFVIERSGDDALKIYFESPENKAIYEAIEPRCPAQVLLDSYNGTTETAREM
jgi:hypothetical protein